jgi:uncharacterized membrane protein YeaQ/YmgE (transglycosylase-associated protein family)
MLCGVDTTIGWIVVALATGALAAAVWGRERLARGTLDAVLGVAGACVGVGGLLIVGDAGLASWIVAPIVLAVGAVAQERVLFADGGPLRT